MDKDGPTQERLPEKPAGPTTSRQVLLGTSPSCLCRIYKKQATHPMVWAKRQRAPLSGAFSCRVRRYRSFARPATQLLAAPNHSSRCLSKAPAWPTIPIPSHPKKIHGFTLWEMLIVVLILSIIAAITLPNLATTDAMKLDTATEEVAEAIRFARAEAIRTKIPGGIFTDTTNERIRVYSMPSFSPTYDIYHPVDKKLYDIQLKTDAFIDGVNLVSASFIFAGGFSSSNYLGFNTDGYPKYTNFGIDNMLTSGTITLSYKGQQRMISIAPMSGRVTIQ